MRQPLSDKEKQFLDELYHPEKKRLNQAKHVLDKYDYQMAMFGVDIRIKANPISAIARIARGVIADLLTIEVNQ